MFLLEHDAKELLAGFGVPVPEGILIESASALSGARLPPGPWMVKAQLSRGGRGKAGAIRPAATTAELAACVSGLLGTRVAGMPAHACRIETRLAGCAEAYLSLALDGTAGEVRVLLAGSGGSEIETLAAAPGALRSASCELRTEAIAATVAQLADAFTEPLRVALSSTGARLAQVFVELECMLLEINPLFVHPDGAACAGDAKLISDDNALFRQPRLRELLVRRARAYPEPARKLEHGCDYVVIDAGGELGLLTTGAGLSMMLIDELRAQGIRPYNFLDVRTGGLRGDATRLVHVLHWIAEGANVKAVLVNVFAGITHLGEFAQLLVEALDRTPQLRVPVVTRLVGNGLDQARELLAAAGIEVETDLGRAVALVRGHLGAR